MQEANGKRSGQRSPSTASTPTTNRRRKVVHAPITEEILRALEKSFKANAVVQRLANALRQEWFKQIEYPQPEPITQAGLWDSKRPKVLLVVHHDGYVEAYGRDVDVYAVELQPWEEAEEEVEKIPFAYKSLHWPQLIRETALVKWTRRPLIICDDVLERVDRKFRNDLLEEARNGS